LHSPARTVVFPHVQKDEQRTGTLGGHNDKQGVEGEGGVVHCHTDAGGVCGTHLNKWCCSTMPYLAPPAFTDFRASRWLALPDKHTEKK
jgi:hypothetical protein